MHTAGLFAAAALLLASVDARGNGPGTSCIVQGQDRLGFGIGNVKGADTDACVSACEKREGCRVWSWTDYQGGTCWLKSYPSQLVPKANVTTTTCVRDGSPWNICVGHYGVDFVGNDIGSKPAKVATDCCEICNQFTGCSAYSWSAANGGTCWLKSSVGTAVGKSDVISSSLINVGPVCAFEYDTDFPGQDIGNKPAVNAGECCSLCKANDSCKAYSWNNFNGGTCWMKSGKGNAVTSPGVISAIVVRV